MMLPNDISRCAGASAAGRTCEHRETCRRFTEPPVTPGWAWYIHPQIPGPCAYYMQAPAPHAPEAKPEGQSQ